MEATRSIRVYLPDRPGALSSISTALAVHEVNIAHLHVVAHDQLTVADDLELTAATEADIDRAIAVFRPDVRVERFDSNAGDPALAMARGLARVASSTSEVAAMEAIVCWAAHVVRADGGALLAAGEGTVSQLAGAPLGEICDGAREAALAVSRDGMATSLGPDNCGQAFPFDGMAAIRAAMAPCGPGRVLVVGRRSHIPFATGELECLGAFADASARIVGWVQ